MNYLILGLRAFILISAVISLGLTGDLAAGAGYSIPRLSFAIFASAFAILFGVFFAVFAEIYERFSFPIINSINDFLNAVFTFAAATALAKTIGNCLHNTYYVSDYNNKTYSQILNYNEITRGSTGDCREAQAAVAFLYFSFFTFLGLLIVNIINCVKLGAFTTSRKSDTVNTGIPTLSSP
ncbi:hypothetical protein NADFUDRAFT_81951 [Nadsonia fulvescens var. elongata DSM 6958]|uniref:MARVEL domain-containing protein n=1 Tax=Nadsonia fulvescens var. elongata DSM 6958 TaxID=857566 RepID=A0A1E3PRA9_9ASCO|nr:hypothetical protein NADFUDRAFT_81951 [Nadsonia fulvescens var. elongata DSM 6958]